MTKTIAMSVLLSVLSMFALTSQAAMLSTQQLVQERSMTSERAQLESLMQREDVKAQFVELGVTPETVQERVAALTESEVVQMNHQMEQMPAGASVVGVAVFIFVVFIITDALGATDVFSFVDPI